MIVSWITLRKLWVGLWITKKAMYMTGLAVNLSFSWSGVTIFTPSNFEETALSVEFPDNSSLDFVLLSSRFLD